MALLRKTYGDQIGEALRNRVAQRLTAPLGLKTVQQGNYYTLPARPEDWDDELPAILVALDQVDIGLDKQDLAFQNAGVDYRYTLHYLVRLDVGEEHQRKVAQGLDAIAGEFLRAGLELTVASAPGLVIRKVMATGFSVGAPDEFDEIEEAVGHGTVSVTVDAEARPIEE